MGEKSPVTRMMNQERMWSMSAVQDAIDKDHKGEKKAPYDELLEILFWTEEIFQQYKSHKKEWWIIYSMPFDLFVDTMGRFFKRKTQPTTILVDEKQERAVNLEEFGWFQGFQKTDKKTSELPALK
jgi:hypothetical protein